MGGARLRREQHAVLAHAAHEQQPIEVGAALVQVGHLGRVRVRVSVALTLTLTLS